MNLLGDNKGNQAQPLLISSHGRYVWSNEPVTFSFRYDTLLIHNKQGPVQQGKAGPTLSEVYHYASRNFFPSAGKLPDTLLSLQPQWNT